MPPSYYQLKFELYSTPDPTKNTETKKSSSNKELEEAEIWIPTPGRSSIFDELPAHRLREPRSTRSNNKKRGDNITGGKAALATKVIDCGRQRGKSHDSRGGQGRNIVRLSESEDEVEEKEGYSFLEERQPRVEDGIGADRAVRDWRFGRVNIESYSGGGDTQGEEMATAPAAPLGPNLGGMGILTKGKLVEQGKNTEVGWGVVHLYKEGDGDSSIGVGEEIGEEGTVLCVPAVPSYMSPSDFLGFIGECWRGDVSHYRMVMTSRMSRYMVLMKFRERRRAEAWRKEFNGKPFDSVEVSFFPRKLCGIEELTVEKTGTDRNLPRSVH